jgi:hypothetical protein
VKESGGRRLSACQQLGWSEIPARFYSDLTEDERREIELEENLQRKDLTSHERSKNLVALDETAAKVMESELLTESVKNPKGGRPQKANSGQRVADRLGIPRTTINDAKQHVAAVKDFPELASPGTYVATVRTGFQFVSHRCCFLPSSLLWNFRRYSWRGYC